MDAGVEIAELTQLLTQLVDSAILVPFDHRLTFTNPKPGLALGEDGSVSAPATFIDSSG